MTLSTSQWHQRYQQQALWTQSIRQHIYDVVGIKQAKIILDVGCGTGVLECELNLISQSQVFGVDIDIKPIQLAREVSPKSIYLVGDCLHLPYQDGKFDVSLCHFLLLWVKDASNAIEEMSRVTHPGGHVLALAEPDYGGRIDYPNELSQIGAWQEKALQQQGANPLMGREIRSIFFHAGLENIEVGVLGGRWAGNQTNSGDDLEWEVLLSDLSQNDAFLKQADILKIRETISREIHQRILFVPTFYAFGMVPG